MKGLDFNATVITVDGKYDRIEFKKLLQHLWQGDWKLQIDHMNKYIKEWNQTKKKRTERIVQVVSHKELCVFLGIMLVARIEGIPGGDLWKDEGKTEGYKILPNIERDRMSGYRFKQIKKFVPYMWADEDLKNKGDVR